MTTLTPAKEIKWTTSPQLYNFRKRVLGWTDDNINTGWEDIIVPQGVAEIGVHLGDQEMIDWAATWLDTQIAAGIHEGEGHVRSALTAGGGDIKGTYLHDYCGNWGIAFAAAAILPARPEQHYKDIIVYVADFIIKHAHRAPNDNTITHGGFSENIWVDTLYYCAPVFGAAYKVTGDRKYAELAIEQCLLHAKHLRSNETGLWHHDAHPVTGVRTINYWGRGNGWIICSLADALRDCPKDIEGYDEVVKLFRSQAEALVRYQHGNGLWRVMPENPDSHLETSASSMILYGLSTGVQLGILEDFVLPMIHRGYGELQTWINSQGQLLGSQFPTGRGNWDNLKLTAFGENSYTTGFMMRFIATYEQVRYNRANSMEWQD